jgi:Fe-S cluster assembly ATP-binding protein
MGELVIKDLYVTTADGGEILKGVDLTVKENEVVALLGPNGHGKSTLLNAIMGNPHYIVTKGSITYDGKDVLAMKVDERARAGLFLGMQLPAEIPGVNNAEFLKAALNAREKTPISFFKFYTLLNNACNELKFPFDMTNRSLNEGFSGGEKKRNEILQMAVLNPKMIMLDEIDSGLDTDAINIVANEINKAHENGASLLLISHYSRLFDMIKPTKAVCLVNGKIAVTGGPELFKRIDKEGYEWIEKELGIKIEKEQVKVVSLGSCAIKDSYKNGNQSK